MWQFFNNIETDYKIETKIYKSDLNAEITGLICLFKTINGKHLL